MGALSEGTIYAEGSARGTAWRSVTRVSGPDAFRIASALCGSQALPIHRAAHERTLTLPCGTIPVLVLTMPGPRSFTGEDIVEIHGPGAPLWVAELGRALETQGARLALPGEFMRRAVAAGRATLQQAEGLLALIEAETVDERRFASDVLRGEVFRLVAAAAEDVLAARAVLESGLDFTEGETGEVAAEEWLGSLRSAILRLDELVAHAPRARASGSLALVGVANAGKSSLCNALTGRPVLLVSDVAGTTRDVLRVELPNGGTLLDGPGDLAPVGSGDAAALALRDRHWQAVRGGLLVVDASAPVWPATSVPLRALVWTKCDRCPGPLPELPAEHRSLPRFATSAHTGAGLGELAEFLAQEARSGTATQTLAVVASTERALTALRRAYAIGSDRGPGELAVWELSEGLAQLDRARGFADVEAVLDRVFARYCLGK